MGRKQLFCLLIFSLLFLKNNCKVYAHDLGVVRMELIEKENFNYVLLVKLPIETEIETPSLILPNGFEFTKESFTIIKGTYSITRYEFKGLNRFLNKEDVLLLPWTLDGAFIQATWLDGSIRTTLIKEYNSGIEININQLKIFSQSKYKQFKHYLILGVEHILLGWDHLAFVLALCLIASGKHLIKLITAFTIGHSITLALAVLSIVNIPVPPVEACIAISIALVANEAFKNEKNSSSSVWVVIAFGLLHGLGFASVLSDIGIEKQELLVGLISFNVGVEVGQLLFVVIVIGILYLVSKIIPKYINTFRKSIAFSLGVMGFFWLFDRIQMFYY